MTETPPKRRRAPRKPKVEPPVPQVDDPCTAYARDVAAGLLPAGPYVRDACARHLRDLKDGPKRGLKWDVEAAARVYRFFKGVLRLNGGEHEGVPFDPLPWQKFVLGSLFGWKIAATGFRRFRMAFVLTGKGSGKSPLAGGIGLYCFVADDEPRAEIYAAASKRDQAMILFRDAVAMVRQSPELASRIGFTPDVPQKEANMSFIQGGSFFRVIASEDGQSGPRPHCALLDEIHEHRDNNVVEMLRAGTKGRRQALIVAITNAEADRTSVCAEYRTYAGKVCRGDIMDDSFFAYVAALDEGDDPFTDESCWPKANPSLGHTFGLQYLREQVTPARGMPSKEAVVRRLNFCQPIDAANPWIDRDLWDAAEQDFDPEEYRGRPCWLGLDLSSTRDLTALAAVWLIGETLTGDPLFASGVWFWRPGDTLDEAAKLDNVPYRVWKNEGHLFAPPGRANDKRQVAEFVKTFTLRHDVQALSYDNAGIPDFQQACDDVGLDCWIDDGKEENEGVGLRMIRHGQGFAGFNSEHVLWMPRSITKLEELVLQGRLRLRRNPVLRWNSASAQLQADAQGNRKWDKRKSTGRIDGMSALSNAVGAATSGPSDAGGSIFDRPELWN